jgi:hypothetical protein
MRSKATRQWVSAFALVALSLGCSEGVTLPPRSCGITVQVRVAIGDVELGNATLLESEVLWDGAVVGRDSASQSVPIQVLEGFVTGVESGSHTVGIRVVRQTVSPSIYIIYLGQVGARCSDGGFQQINIESIAPQALSTGQLITIPVTIARFLPL